MYLYVYIAHTWMQMKKDATTIDQARKPPSSLSFLTILCRSAEKIKRDSASVSVLADVQLSCYWSKTVGMIDLLHLLCKSTNTRCGACRYHIWSCILELTIVIVIIGAIYHSLIFLIVKTANKLCFMSFFINCLHKNIAKTKIGQNHTNVSCCKMSLLA